MLLLNPRDELGTKLGEKGRNREHGRRDADVSADLTLAGVSWQHN